MPVTSPEAKARKRARDNRRHEGFTEEQRAVRARRARTRRAWERVHGLYLLAVEQRARRGR